MRRFGSVVGLALLVTGLAVACIGRSDVGKQAGVPTPTPTGGWQLDHVVLVVPDLDTAVTQARAAGFSVTSGGEPAGGFDRNALIPFEDGSYVELFSPVDPAAFDQLAGLLASGQFDQAMAGRDAMATRFVGHVARGPGIADFAVTRAGLESELATQCDRLRAADIPCSGPIDMSRQLDDERVARWQVDVPGSLALPFLIADSGSRDTRVPTGVASLHANGATGIAALTVGSRQPEFNAARLAVLLQQEPQSAGDGESAFMLGAPSAPGDEATIALVARRAERDGPTALVLRGSGSQTARQVSVGGVSVTLQ